MKKSIEKFYLGIILVAIGTVLANTLPVGELQVVGDAFSIGAWIYLIIATFQLIKHKIKNKKLT
jgi:hypothetical protein